MRRQALGLQSPASTAVVGRQALTAIIVLGAIWLLNDYRGVPTPVLLLTLLLLGGMFMATRTAFGRRIYAIGGNLEAARLSGINVERTKLAVFAINGLMVAIAGLILQFSTRRWFTFCGKYRRTGRNCSMCDWRHQSGRRRRERGRSGNGGIHHGFAG